MLIRSLALAVLAALTLHAAPRSAAAADLGDGYSGSPYDDPRYADIYRHPPRRDWSQREDTYDDDDDRGYARDRDDDEDDDDDDRYGYDDRDDDTPDRTWRRRDRRYGDYLPPMTATPRFSDDWRRGRRDCVARWRIRHLLEADGWRDIRPLSLEGATAVVRATRRESGRTFDLRVDRCSGAILSARRSFGRAYGFYQPPR